jgi:hypothetical protein
MKTFLLVLLLLAASLYAFTTYFSVNSERLKDGTYKVQVVNKFNGNSYTLMGD